MKIINYLLAVIFLIFAVIQFNDPDPLLWVLVYGYISLVSGMAVYGKYNRYMIISGMVITMLGGLYLFPAFIELITEHRFSEITAEMHADKNYIEESRESLGLFIAFFVLLFHFIQMKKVE